MRADFAQMMWDSDRLKWMVRISVGEEVIRRYCDLPKNASEQELRGAAEKMLQDEGYEIDGTAIKFEKIMVA
jgi:hypothetical protein